MDELLQLYKRDCNVRSCPRVVDALVVIISPSPSVTLLQYLRDLLGESSLTISRDTTFEDFVVALEVEEAKEKDEARRRLGSIVKKNKIHVTLFHEELVEKERVHYEEEQKRKKRREERWYRLL